MGTLLEVEFQELIKNLYKLVVKAYRKLTVLVQGLQFIFPEFYALTILTLTIAKQDSGIMTS